MHTERRAAFDPLAAHTGIRHAVPHLAEIKKPMLNFSLLDIRFPKRHAAWLLRRAAQSRLLR